MLVILFDLWCLCRECVTFKRERRYRHIFHIFLSLPLIIILAGNFKVLIIPSKLRKKALGKDTYWPFQMHGFPIGFHYPANATILSQSGARKNPINKTILYAIIKACIVGELNDDGTQSFLRFEKKDWSKLQSFPPLLTLLTGSQMSMC